MAKRKKKITAEQQAFDERTRMIEEYLARKREAIAARKQANAGG